MSSRRMEPAERRSCKEAEARFALGGSSNVDGFPHADSLSPEALATHPMHPCIHACGWQSAAPPASFHRPSSPPPFSLAVVLWARQRLLDSRFQSLPYAKKAVARITAIYG